MPGAEALATQRRLAALLSYNLKQEYSKVCGFVRARMSLAIVRYNIRLLRGPSDNGVRIWQQPDLMYWAVMAMLAPWRG